MELEPKTIEDYWQDIKEKKCIYCGVEFRREDVDRHFYEYLPLFLIKGITDNRSIFFAWDEECQEIVFMHYRCMT